MKNRKLLSIINFDFEAKVYLVFFLIFIASRAVNIGFILTPLATLDTAGYVHLSSLSIGDIELWAGSRPFLYPLLLKLFGGNFSILALFQTVFSVFAWGLLAFSFSKHFNNTITRVFAFAFILIFSNAAIIAPWDVSIMTESLNFSLFAMTFALWLLFLKNENLFLLLSFIVAVSLWTFIRETNGWLAIMFGGVVLVVGILRKKKYYLLVAIGVFSAFAINYLLGGVENGMNQRWIFPFLNVVSKRILKHNGRFKWFQEHGMPVSPDLMQLEGMDANGNEKAFYESPELGSFREWLVKDGRKTYILFLLTHRYYVFSRPTQELSYLSMANNDEHIPGNFKLMPMMVNDIVLLNIDLTRLMQFGMIASGIAILFLAIRRNGLWLTLVIGMALFYPHLAIVWHGDAMGLSRHSLLANVQLRLSIWMILLAMLNEFLVIKQAINTRLLSFRAP